MASETISITDEERAEERQEFADGIIERFDDHLDALTGIREELLTRIEELEGCVEHLETEHARLLADNEVLASDMDARARDHVRLRSALQRYGRHLDGCDTGVAGGPVCGCGFHRALGRGAGEP